MNLRDIMTPFDELACVTPGTTLPAVGKKMKEADTGVIPVVDGTASGKLLGVITDRDIAVRAVAAGVDLNTAAVENYMSPNPVTASPDTSTKEAARIMADKQLHRLPVVEDGRLAGVVSLGDLAETQSRQAAKALEGISEGAKVETRIQ